MKMRIIAAVLALACAAACLLLVVQMVQGAA